MEKVLNVTKKARVEDPDWVQSKAERKDAEAGKSPAKDTSVAEVAVNDQLEDADLNAVVLPIASK